MLNEQHVVRYTKSSLVIRDDDGKAIGVFPQAFELKEGEKYLSMSWLEYYDGERAKRLKAALSDLQLSTTRKAVLATVNVGDFHTACRSCGRRVRIVYEPVQGNPSHAAIRQMANDSNLLLGMLADLASRDFAVVADVMAS